MPGADVSVTAPAPPHPRSPLVQRDCVTFPYAIRQFPHLELLSQSKHFKGKDPIPGPGPGPGQRHAPAAGPLTHPPPPGPTAGWTRSFPPLGWLLGNGCLGTSAGSMCRVSWVTTGARDPPRLGLGATGLRPRAKGRKVAGARPEGHSATRRCLGRRLCTNVVAETTPRKSWTLNPNRVDWFSRGRHRGVKVISSLP